MMTYKNEDKARKVIIRGDGSKVEYVPICDYFPDKHPTYFFCYIKNYGREKYVVKSSFKE